MILQSLSGSGAPVPSNQTPALPAIHQESPADLEDRLESAEKKKCGLEETVSRYSIGKKRCERAYKITRLLAIGGFTAFGAAALMSSMVPFIAGAAIGSISYIASGFFKGRTQYFTRMLPIATEDLAEASRQFEKTKKRYDNIHGSVKGMVEAVGKDGTKDEIIQDDDFVFINGVKLEKKYRHSDGILHDLFGKLEDK